MSREIKFRAWDASEKTMEYGGMERMGGYHEPMGNPVMQYTGLKDKNGVEIYEGDILSEVSMAGVIANAIVVYAQASFALLHISVERYSDRIYSKNWHSEVIGNIYENPELLERLAA